jgi:hypothetical protein
MKPVAWTIILGIALPAAAGAAPQQAPDGIVTIRKKGSAWSFKIVPEGRKKVVVDEKELETDVPQMLHVAYAIDEPYAPISPPPGSSTFVLTEPNGSRTISMFREGKRYADQASALPDLLNQTRDEWSELQRLMVEEFYQFDLDFPGGGWEELSKLLRERLTAAYEQQFPEILKPYLPAKVEIEISAKPGQNARYPAIQAKAVTLARLRSFGPAPQVEGKAESTPRVSEREDKRIELVMDVTKSTTQLMMTDGNAIKAGALDVAFFHLGSKPNLPGADHVVALFEMAWKTRGVPIYAKVKYHPETKTLMVQGVFDEIQAADKVFATLTGRPAPIESSANPFDVLNGHLERIAELLKKQAEDKDK